MKELLDYEAWADREVIARLGAIASPPPRALATIAHIVATEWLWLSRLRGSPSPLAVWPSLTLDECASQLEAATDAWRAAPIDDEQLVTYTNSRGETFTSRAADIVMHVFLHGAYHRGQIATLLREAGEEPVNTDYIHYVRTR